MAGTDQLRAAEPLADGPGRGGEIRRSAGSLALSGAAGVIVPLAVMAIMGRINGEVLYIRSVYMPLAFLYISLQMGFDVSNQVAAAISRGRDRVRDVVPVALSMGRVGAVIWGALTVLVMVSAPGLASLMHMRPELIGTFTAFVRWTCLASMLFLPTTLCASSLRGLGHAGSAAVIVVMGGSVEVGGVALLGYGTDLGVYSLPIAIGAGGTVSLVVGLVQVHRRGVWKARGPLVWRSEATEQLTRTGLPLAMSFVVIGASNFGLLWILGPFGPDVVSGFAAAATLESLVLVPSTAIGSATAIVMNRLRGAGRLDDVPRVLGSGMRHAVAVYAVIGLALWLGRDGIARLMTDDPRVAVETAHFLSIVGLSYGCLGVTVTAVVLIEQIGGGVIALVANIPYFGGMFVIGGVIARSRHESAGLYGTIAALNLLGILTVPLITWLFVRRMVRAPRELT
ncbi:MATE family efflux transporter [Spirillospora sp. NPDC052269]